MQNVKEIDSLIRRVVESFAAELSNIRAKSGQRLGSYGTSQFTLEVSIGQGETCGMSVKFEQGYGNNVKAATYESCLREVYRRAGFDEQEEGLLREASSALVTLPVPVQVPDDEIPF